MRMICLVNGSEGPRPTPLTAPTRSPTAKVTRRDPSAAENQKRCCAGFCRNLLLPFLVTRASERARDRGSEREQKQKC
ncbi:hypothetical protein BHE74_00017074, partial [Ensete ventricosum]